MNFADEWVIRVKQIGYLRFLDLFSEIFCFQNHKKLETNLQLCSCTCFFICLVLVLLVLFLIMHLYGFRGASIALICSGAFLNVKFTVDQFIFLYFSEICVLFPFCENWEKVKNKDKKRGRKSQQAIRYDFCVFFFLFYSKKSLKKWQ